MERLTRTETSQKIIYTLGHTRWTFDKRDHSRLQDVLDWLFEYQALGTVEELAALVKARDEHKAYKLDGFYCDICKKKHMRVIEIDRVYFTRAEAEAALGGGGDG